MNDLKGGVKSLTEDLCTSLPHFKAGPYPKTKVIACINRHNNARALTRRGQNLYEP